MIKVNIKIFLHISEVVLIAFVLQAAHTHNVFLMEGIWSRCTPIYEKLRQELSNGTVGRVRQVIVNFGLVINSERVR